MNYILVQEGMEPQYLDIPIRSFMKSVLREDPEIIAVKYTTITYRYSNGPRETKPLGELKKGDDSPNFPERKATKAHSGRRARG